MKELLLHASCVCRFGRAVVLRGPSGAGKSALALALVDRGWMLVADDYTALNQQADLLLARSPDRLRGMLEVYGRGIISLPARLESAVVLVADLVPRLAARLPELTSETLLGVRVPVVEVPHRDLRAASMIEETLRRTPDLG